MKLGSFVLHEYERNLYAVAEIIPNEEDDEAEGGESGSEELCVRNLSKVKRGKAFEEKKTFVQTTEQDSIDRETVREILPMSEFGKTSRTKHFYSFKYDFGTVCGDTMCTNLW